MTRRDLILKWLLYALGLLPIFALDLYVLPQFPIFGIIPTLLPVAAITVATLEGPVAGAGFGLFVGILSDALIPGTPGSMTVGLAFLGLCAGAAARYGVRQNMLGCLICSSGALALIALIRIFSHLLQGKAGLWPLLAVAVPEIFLSLIFLPLIYGIFYWIYQRVPKPSLIA